MAQLRGILDHDDIRPVLNRIVVPLVLLQSSQSTFVDADLAVNALEKARVDRAPSAASAVRTGGTIFSVDYVDCGHEMNQENRKIIATTVFDVLKASVEEEEVTTVVSLDDPPKSFLSYASAPAPAAQDQEVVAALRRAREREELEKSMAAAFDAEDSRVSTAQPVEEESSSSSSEEEYVDSDALSEDDETVVTVDSQGVEKKKRRRRANKGSSEKRRKRAEKRRLAAFAEGRSGREHQDRGTGRTFFDAIRGLSEPRGAQEGRAPVASLPRGRRSRPR